jgi:hypothetical protein
VHGLHHAVPDRRDLARITTLPVAAEYPVKLWRPKDLDPSFLRPGVSGTAIVYAPIPHRLTSSDGCFSSDGL